jgi:hypothetical protein
MRIILSALLTFMTLYSNTIDVTSISKKIDDLKNNKKSSATLDYRVYDPFYTAKPLLATKERKPTNTAKRPIVLQTILNHKVLIDGRWYGVGDHVHGARITAIKENTITLLSSGKHVVISLRTRKNIIKTKERSR